MEDGIGPQQSMLHVAACIFAYDMIIWLFNSRSIHDEQINECI